jgi:hypothetical protein
MPHLFKTIIATCAWLPAFTGIQAQEESGKSRFSPKELTIPAAPVFDVMGVTASQINRTADIKEFKVDWSFKSWKLNPNLAIQSQPVWEMLYNRKNISKYQAASPFMRKLAALDISIGSVQDENNDRRIGFAFKANLLRQKDPLMAHELYLDLADKYDHEKKMLDSTLHLLQQQLDTTTNLLEKPSLRSQLSGMEEQLNTLHSRRNKEMNERAAVFVKEHWNASSLDVAFGRVYSYQTDSTGSLKSLRLNRNTGYSGWLNGSVGLGKKFLLSALFRSSWYEEELDFLVKDLATGEEQSHKAVAENTLLTMGMNLRYGGAAYTFFAEFLYERKGLKTPLHALSEAFTAPAGFEVVSNTVKWDVVNPNTISFAGDWRIGRSVILNYGMRCVFDNNWKFTTFTPIVTLACMMR